MPCSDNAPYDPQYDADRDTMARLACLHCRTVSVPEWAQDWWKRHKARDKREAAQEAVSRFFKWLSPGDDYSLFEGLVPLHSTSAGWRIPNVAKPGEMFSEYYAGTRLVELVTALELPEELELDDLTEFIFNLLKHTTVKKP